MLIPNDTAAFRAGFRILPIASDVISRDRPAVERLRNSYGLRNDVAAALERLEKRLARESE